MEILCDCEGDLLQPDLPAAVPTTNQPTTHDRTIRTKAHDQREDGTKDDDEQDDDDAPLIHSQFVDNLNPSNTRAITSKHIVQQSNKRGFICHTHHE